MDDDGLISAMMEQSGLGADDAGAALNAIVDVVVGQLELGFRVEIEGFGTFERFNIAASQRVDPRTGETVETPGRSVGTFLFSGDLA